MVTLEDIRIIALALPDVSEDTHFRLPTFKVNGKGFITVQNGAAILAVSQADTEALAETEPAKYESVWRSRKFFVGVKVALSEVSVNEIEKLISLAFNNKK